MGRASRLLTGFDHGPAAQMLAGAAIGVAGAAALIFGLSQRGPLIPVMAMLALPVVVAVVLRPRYAVLTLIFAMAFVEEFRGGIGDSAAGGDEHLRSERTPFYGATIGLPGLYLPDIMIGGALALCLLRVLLQREPLTLRFDKIGAGLCIVAFATLLSILVPLGGPEPFGPPVLDLSTIGSVTLPEKNVSDVARYLPVLQYKLFVLLFPAYLLGLMFFRAERDITQTIRVVGVAMVGTVILGLVRVAMNPDAIRNLVPVIFDTASVALMAMTVFYSVGRWSSNHYPTARAAFQAMLCVALLALILLSFRRTMWGAIAVAMLLFPFVLPRHALSRLFAIVGVGMALGLIAVVTTPVGHALVQSVISRAGETHLSQSSTLYRFAILVWLVQNLEDIPLFGYGLAPLWNEKIYIRFFVTSMENVHSLYLWILVRMGVFGFLAVCAGTVLILLRIREVFRSTADEQYRILVGVILLSIVMYLFNGVFNPVYANVRHLVPLGLALALVTQLPHILAGRDAAGPASGRA